ncbi:hypothetical protein TNCV_3202771 [Trichonephila clavipes]|nr:hypothetical protein TNCV_3202771 [Trichonephila clavipes]
MLRSWNKVPFTKIFAKTDPQRNAFSQRSSSPGLIEDETFKDSDIINNLIDYEDGQEEPDSLRAEKTCKDPAFQQIGKAFS